MKTNRDQLSHAFNSLRDDTLQEAVIAMENETSAVPKATHTRRWLTATAACLTAVLALGTALTLPLLKTDEPTPTPMPEQNTSDPNATDPNATEDVLFYYDAPLVRLLSLSTEETDENEMGNGSNVTIQLDDDISVVHNYYLLLNDLQVGETVTLTSHNATLVQGDIHERPGPETTTHINQASVEVRPNHHDLAPYMPTVTHVYDPTSYLEPVFIWGYRDMYGVAESRLEGNVFEDYVDFVIRDADGNITGAGCLYLANKKVMKLEENNPYFNACSISRGKILGAVRFNDPATVTEEQVDALLDDMKDGTAGIATAMFDESTYTPNEMFIKNWGEILETEYPEYMSEDAPYLILRGGSELFDGVRHLLISTPDKYKELRSVFFFDDGTYAIAEPENCKCICPICGEIEYPEHVFFDQIHKVTDPTEVYRHKQETYWIFELNDGRTMKVSTADKTFTFIAEPETAA